MRARANTFKTGQSERPGFSAGGLPLSPKVALEEIGRCVLAIEVAINIGEDYFEHKTALLSAVEQARDAGCSEEEIRQARRGF